MAEKVGYIGLGIMGRPMALNLLRAGYPVWVYARRTEALPPLTDAGATVCSSPADVARHAEVVFTNVSDTPDVEQIVLGDNGIIHGAKHGAVVVDNSTISPSATRSMANKLRNAGVEMLDAPVSGGEKGAIDGTLSIMAGGRTEAFERVLPLLQVLGKNVVHVGGNGAGQVTKACNQVVIAQTIAAVGEALILATASGVNPVKVREALLGGFAGSRVLEVHGQRMLERDFEPGFMARLHQKDMRIVLETARELGLALPGAAQVTQYINALVGSGDGELDSTALVTVQERLSDTEIEARK
ncbi:MAG: 2-hydroxy-3-oxopropionate reductase [Gammaproteobacteria bacterium]|nr:2-hydroxy-3-oxopropionate reductase [Gammaproteobacteria bacterium]